MNKFLIFGGGVAICAIVITILSLKNKALKAENESLKSNLQALILSLNQQKAIIKDHSDFVSEVSQIQQKSEEAKEALDTEIKEAQTSEKPIENNIKIGNDLVNRFNTSK